MATGANLIAGRLASAGAKRAFGIPGGEVLALIEGLESASITFVLTKHENCAGFMAEGAWHAGGGLPVLVATLGPGVANAANVVANAMQDRVPLIFLTGCVDAELASRYTHQIFDHQALMRPVVKGTYRLTAGSIEQVMDKAIALALEGQPGPVHIDVPINLAEGQADAANQNSFVLPEIGAAPAEAIAAARAALSQAQRPLIIAGVDAVNDEAGPEIRELCERHKIPLITSYKGKGLLDEGSDLALGAAGLSPKADAVLLPFVKAADTIVLAGYDPIEMRIGWTDPWSSSAQIVDVTPVLRDHGMHRATLTLTGSVKRNLAVLADEVTSGAVWIDGEPAGVKANLKDAFAPEPGPAGQLTPDQVFATVRKVAPSNTVATVDSGAHRILFSQMWQTINARSVLQSTALCTMGCALPLAMGYKLSQPETPVIVIVGDACLEMVLGELATLRDLKLAIPIIVLADASLGLIELKQRNAQRPNAGVDFGATDFPAVAEAFGGSGAWIDTEDQLARETQRALDRDGFTILACRIGRRAYDGKI